MQPYMLLAVVIRFAVDFMLLYAAKRLCSPCSGFFRPMLGAFFGAIYSGVCLLPRFTFLQDNGWYILNVLLCCVISFGFGRAGFSSTAIFCMLRLALDGLAIKGGYGMELIFGILLSGLSILGFGSKLPGKWYIPVELRCGGKTLHLQALWDTGHDLRDPITGKSILVVGADVAQKLAGLNPEQLKKPVETMTTVSGLRLIPYQTVEKTGQMMLAMMLTETKIGGKKRACLVAFAPQVLDCSGKFQALIGGTI